MKKYRPIGYKERAYIMDLGRDGRSTIEIASLLRETYPPGRTRAAIRSMLSQAGIKSKTFTRNPGFTMQAPNVPKPVVGKAETLIAQVKALGYDVTRADEPEKHVKLTPGLFDGQRELRIGLLADTQLCSIYQQLTYLHDTYAFFEREGIKIVLNAGDLLDGWTVYRGHVHEVFKVGNDAQIKYAIDNYPKSKTVQTYVVAGNHDYSFFSDRGCNALKAVCDARDDLIYLGDYGAYLELLGQRIYLHHPGGGSTYAKSYPAQKQIAGFSPEAKPDFLIRGHLHRFCHILDRNVEAVDLPSFQAQTPYMKQKGLTAEVGFCVLTIKVNDAEGFQDNLVGSKLEHYPFFIPKERDY
jgi:hypothetical protein